MSFVADLLELHHDVMAILYDEVSRKIAAIATGGALAPKLMCVVIRCDDRLAQGLLYACGGDTSAGDRVRFSSGVSPGTAVAALAITDVIRFLEIADQVTMAYALRSRPPKDRFWALGISGGSVMLESQMIRGSRFV
jgi:hypothetical protein